MADVTHPIAALIAGVPRYYLNDDTPGVYLDPDGNFVMLDEVLAALEATPDAAQPMPPNGWNVMQLGQIGWHVVQEGDDWKVTRLFGPEVLSRDGDGGAVASDPDAYLSGGAGAAEAPATDERERALREALIAVRIAREAVIHSGNRAYIDGISVGHDRAERAILALIGEARDG